MRSPTKQDGTDRRKTERRAETSGSPGSRPRDRRVVEQRGVVTSKVDALEDIHKWERASERAKRVATEKSPTELDPSN